MNKLKKEIVSKNKDEPFLAFCKAKMNSGFFLSQK